MYHKTYYNVLFVSMSFQILALLLEGRRKNSGGRSSRRGSSAQYRKLDNNLEEAMADNSEDTVRHVIY